MADLAFYQQRRVIGPQDDLRAPTKHKYSHVKEYMETLYEEEFALLAAKCPLWVEYNKATGLGTSPQVFELLLDRALVLGAGETRLNQMRGTIKHEFLKLEYQKRPWESGRISDFYRLADTHYENVKVCRNRGLAQTYILAAPRIYAEKRRDVGL